MIQFLQKRLKLAGILTFILVSLLLLLPTATFAQSQSLCDKISEGTGGFFSCGQEQTSFTDFEGGLSAPDAAGYAPGLVQATSAREYIKNIINFALGFLGILAIAIVIYGGFLYVTDAGKSEQAEKGKKSIMYAVIGILIILGSYALVNTILKAPSGSDQSLNGAAPSSALDQSQDRRLFFNYAAVSLQTIARDFVTAYQFYSETKTDLERVLNVDEERNVKSPGDLKLMLQNKKNLIVNINNKAAPLSQVAEKSKQALVVLDKYIQTSDQKIVELAESTEKLTWESFWTTDYTRFKLDINSDVGPHGILAANDSDFAFSTQKLHEKLVDLYIRVQASVELPAIQAAFSDVFEGMRLLVGNLANPASGPSASLLKGFASLFYDIAKAADGPGPALNVDAASNANILKIVNDLGKLYELVKDVQFVYATINTDVTEGNAPLIINFDALKSRDPNNHTIANENYSWDFGDNSSIAIGSTVSHIYTEPGTYVVKLEVKAPEADTGKGEKQPANGVAYRTITVRPPSSRIQLKAIINGKEFVLSEYNQAGFQTKNIQDITITTAEAKEGVIFDASQTQTGNGNSFQSLPKTGTAKVRWDFGDRNNANSIVSGPPDTISQTQKIIYNKEGSYRVTLEVTDDRGIADRKVFNVHVSSLAARITVNPGTEGNLGQEFLLDGSASASDSGQIKTYDWKIMKESVLNQPPKEITDPQFKNKDVLRYAFSEPGNYNVNLTVNDGAKDASAAVRIGVTSKPPVAQFSFANPDKAKPNTYVFDAGRSYDPDGTAELQYKWEVNAAPGECFYLDNKTEIDCTAAFKDFSSDKKLMKPKMKFKKGKYTVTLDVEDPVEPGKSIPQEQEINVENDLDVGFGDEGEALTGKLEDGAANITFSIQSSSGVSYELDTGDGQKESGTLNGTTSVKHAYNKAGTFMTKLSVFDAEDNENSINRKVFIASAETPVAAISLTVDGEDVIDTTGEIIINRKNTLSFDGGKSLNTDGTGRRLLYSWDFGDGQKSSKKEVTHTYKELPPKGTDYYKVTLKVSSEDDPGKVSQADEVKIKVVSLAPIIRGLTAVPVNSTLTTPVAVNVSANSPEDPDGKIVTYRWWYHNIDAPDEELGLQITQTPNATLTLGTNGEEGVKKTYSFAVIATDNENQTFKSLEQLNSSIVPTLTVTNGPNKAPIAKFNVDRSNILVGETINFSSSSSDPDASGSIVKYIWDFDGNGFGDDVLNNDYNKANVSYTYKTGHREGVRVRLKIVDNNGAEAVSDPVTIYVDAPSSPPVAAFITQIEGKKVKFTNNSTVDTGGGAELKSYTWDFDVNIDSNGDGTKENDLDSNEANPSFEYKEYGVYRARLTVEDTQGGKNFVTNFVNVKGTTTSSNSTTVNSTGELDARLTSVPEASMKDGRIHLSGDKGTVIFNFASSQGNIRSYVIDRNIYFDSNGNGRKDDDEDYKTDTSGTWSGQFSKSDGTIRLRLTVVDAAGKKDSVEKDVVFDAVTLTSTGGTKIPSLLGSNVFAGAGSLNLSVLVSIAGFALVGYGIFLVTSEPKKSKNKK
jgi:PKD repeat protein